MKPIYLKIKNFMSHKESEIDFEKFNSALLIGNIEGDYSRSNGSGKSSVQESIVWVLFNKTRAATVDDIILWGETECEGEFHFLLNDISYKVVRTRSRTKGTSTVGFWELHNGEWVDKSGSTSRLTNKNIVDVIKVDHKTFLNSVYFRQGDVSEFAESDAGRKKEILKSIIDLSKWDEYEKNVKSTLKKYKQDCALLTANTLSLESTKKELEETQITHDSLKNRIMTLKTNGAALDQKIEKLSVQYSVMKENLDTDRWDQIVAESAELTNKKKIIAKKASSLKSEIKDYASRIENLDIQINKNEEDLMSIVVTPDAQEKLNEKTEELHRYSADIRSSQERLSELSQVKIYQGKCYTCGQTTDDKLHKKLESEHEERLKAVNRKNIFANNRLNQIKPEIANLKVAVRNNKKHKSITSSVANQKAKREMLASHYSRITAEFSSQEKMYNEISSRLIANEKILESLKSDNFNQLRIEIKALKSKKSDNYKTLEQSNRSLGIASQKVVNLKEKIQSMNHSFKQLKEKEKNKFVYERFAKLLSKNGIQTILLNAVIQDLEIISNEIMDCICKEEFEIILDTQRVGSDGVSIVDTLDLKVKKDGFTQNYKSLSGGEQFRVSLALRIALSEVSSKHGGSSLGFLLLDEINSPLDRDGTENLFVNVIKALEEKYKILVITHDDILKEKFSNVIDVTKVNGESTIKFQQR